jgi:hypothetical protein
VTFGALLVLITLSSVVDTIVSPYQSLFKNTNPVLAPLSRGPSCCCILQQPLPAAA